MRAVAGDAVDLGDALDAELHPAGGAMRADPAAAVVVDHRPLPDPGLPFVDSGTDRDDHAARLVPGDDRVAGPEAEGRRGLAGRGTVEFEIASAHAGSLDLQDHLARTRGRIRKIPQLDLPVAGEHRTLHRASPSPGAWPAPDHPFEPAPERWRADAGRGCWALTGRRSRRQSRRLARRQDTACHVRKTRPEDPVPMALHPQIQMALKAMADAGLPAIESMSPPEARAVFDTMAKARGGTPAPEIGRAHV